MKKIITIMVFMALFTGLKAQVVVFSENFSSTTTDSLPAGWTKFNLDGQTPNSGVTGLGEPFDKAWGVYDLSSDGFFSGKAAWTTSWFTTSVTANRWMFTPAIVVPATNAVIQYSELMATADGSDAGYELHIMTTAPTASNIMASAILLTIPATAQTPTTRSVDLSAYAGQTVYIGWRDNDNTEAILGINDVVVESLPNIDVALTSINTPAYVATGNTNITGTVTNNGANAITSFNVAYKITGTTSYTSPVYAVTGVNITTLGTYNFTHGTPAALTVGQDSLKVIISNINGGTNASSADTVLKQAVTVVSSVPAKGVFCEEETSVLCGYCVRGIVYMDSMATQHPADWVGVACHSAGMGTDPMVVTAWDNGNTSFPGFSGYPSVIVDRTILDDPSNLAADYATEKAVVAPVSVALANITYNPSTKQVSFDVNATSVTTGTVNWRINGAIYEMNVTYAQYPIADSTEFQQHNYYSNADGYGLGPMGGFENLADPVPAAEMHFNYVGRAILGGYAGTSGSIPTSITDGTTYSKTYTYTVPSTEIESDLHVVGFVVDQASGKVLNSIQSGNIVITGVHELQANGYKMFPNPTRGIVNFSGLSGNSQITVTNVYGETLMYAENTNIIDLSGFANGFYFVNIKSNDTVVTEKIVLNK
jgi:hypothetical protein